MNTKNIKLKEQTITVQNLKENTETTLTEQYIYTKDFSLKYTFLVENGFVKFVKSVEL